jgi:hypothetical protein
MHMTVYAGLRPDKFDDYATPPDTCVAEKEG